MSQHGTCSFNKVFYREDPEKFTIDISTEKFNSILQQQSHIKKYTEDFKSHSILKGTVEDSFSVSIQIYQREYQGELVYANRGVHVRHTHKSGAYCIVGGQVSYVYEDAERNTNAYLKRVYDYPGQLGEWAGYVVFQSTLEFLRAIVIDVLVKQAELTSEEDNGGCVSENVPSFSQYFMSTTFSDVEVWAEGGIYPCHRLILADKSPVFARILDYVEKRVELNDVGANVMRELLQFIYTNSADCLANGNLEATIQLFLIADRFLIDELKSRCEEVMVARIKGTHALELWDIANHFGLKKLANAIRMFCWANRNLIFIKESPVQELAKSCFPHLICSPRNECPFCQE